MTKLPVTRGRSDAPAAVQEASHRVRDPGEGAMSDRAHRRLTPSQKHLLPVIRSFGSAGATARQIRLRATRTGGRPNERRPR